MNSLSTKERAFQAVNQAQPDLFSDKNEPSEAINNQQSTTMAA